MAIPVAAVLGSWIVLAFQHRAIALQPIDYVKAISAEISRADSPSRGWCVVKAVSGMFWNSYEVRMKDGRAFSCLPFFQAIPNPEETVFVTVHGVFNQSVRCKHPVNPPMHA